MLKLISENNSNFYQGKITIDVLAVDKLCGQGLKAEKSLKKDSEIRVVGRICKDKS